jgi:hypothetical protein
MRLIRDGRGGSAMGGGGASILQAVSLVETQSIVKVNTRSREWRKEMLTSGGLIHEFCDDIKLDVIRLQRFNYGFAGLNEPPNVEFHAPLAPVLRGEGSMNVHRCFYGNLKVKLL